MARFSCFYCCAVLVTALAIAPVGSFAQSQVLSAKVVSASQKMDIASKFDAAFQFMVFVVITDDDKTVALAQGIYGEIATGLLSLMSLNQKRAAHDQVQALNNKYLR